MSIYRANAKTFNNEDKIVDVMDRMGEFNPLQLTCEDILNLKNVKSLLMGIGIIIIHMQYHNQPQFHSTSLPLKVKYCKSFSASYQSPFS